jgi:hypothetical protein
MMNPMPARPARDAALLVALLLTLGGCGEPESGKKSPGTVITVKAQATRLSRPPLPLEILPYDEALVIHEYQVLEKIEGDAPKGTIRVARWAVSGGTAQTPLPADHQSAGATLKLAPLDSIPGLNSVHKRDDLPFDPDARTFLDLTQSLALPHPPAQIRHDYRVGMDDRMRAYWALRHQLKLVVLGNSHADCAVMPHLFHEVENRATPVCMSLSPAGSGLPLQSLIAKEYLADLPKLEWVIWGVSPRIFNAHGTHDRRHDQFIHSPAYAYDQSHRSELWPVPDGLPILTDADLKKKFDFHRRDLGWAARTESELKIPLDAAEETRIIQLGRLVRFEESVALWTQFEETLRALTDRGVRVLLFTPPYHPLLAKGNTIDPSGTGHADYAKIVARLQSIDAANPLVFFIDIHQGGRHDFPHEEFANPDHLLETGSRRLTPQLVEIVNRESPVP